MELKKIELLTISFIFFVHGLVCTMVVAIFQLNHPLFPAMILVFLVVGFFYLVYYKVKDILPVSPRLLLLLPPVMYMAFIFSLSSLPRSGIKAGLPTIYLHSVEYFTLSFLFIWALNKGISSKIETTTVLISLFTCLVYSFLDEFHQYFVPGRHTSLIDIIFDSIGIVLGLAAFHFYRMIIVSNA